MSRLADELAAAIAKLPAGTATAITATQVAPDGTRTSIQVTLADRQTVVTTDMKPLPVPGSGAAGSWLDPALWPRAAQALFGSPLGPAPEWPLPEPEKRLRLVADNTTSEAMEDDHGGHAA